MRHLYWALSEVTRFGRPDITNADRPAGWRAWIAGVALADGIVCWIAALILCSLFGVRFIGVVISAAQDTPSVGLPIARPSVSPTIAGRIGN